MQNYYGSALRFLWVRPRPGFPTQGLLRAGHHTIRCALGRSGIGIKRGEGDGVTPRGRFRLLHAMIRADRMPVQRAAISLSNIRPDDGWCDEPGNRNYNRPVNLPYCGHHEQLNREDHLYDVTLVMDYNVSTRMTVGGSAIFFHLAQADYSPTEGCIAIARSDMLWLLPRIGTETEMVVG